MLFTLDVNCLYAVESGEPAGPYVIALRDAHRAGRADVAALGMSGSERQRGGIYLDNIQHFLQWLEKIQMHDLPLLKPQAIQAVTFWGWSVYGDPNDALDRDIHNIIAPNIDYRWSDYAAAQGVSVDDKASKAWKVWVNNKCDVQGLWSHIRNGRDIFVTSNTKDFQAHMADLLSLGAGQIATPEEAVASL